MLTKVISGGQTGVDQAGLFAARKAGLATGGYACRDWQTEAGPAPWLADYGLVECDKPGYPARTEANVRSCDGVLWFGSTDSPGFRCTQRAARQFDKPLLIVKADEQAERIVHEWIAGHYGIVTLMVGGNRASTNPGLGPEVEAFLIRVFTREAI